MSQKINIEIIRDYYTAIKSFSRSYNIKILDSKEPTIQLIDAKSYVKNKLERFLQKMRCFNFDFGRNLQKLNTAKARRVTNYFDFNAGLATNDLNIDETLELTYKVIIYRIQK